MRVTCKTHSYLECCLEYNEIQGLCKEFSRIAGDPEIQDPDVFEHKVRLCTQETLEETPYQAEKDL